MTETYTGMEKINELASTLITELTNYSNSVHNDLSYADYDEMNQRVREYCEKGWDTESARYQASRDKEIYDWETEENKETYAHLDKIKKAIEMLETLTLKEDK